MKITFLGYGNVGATIADNFQRHGHVVTLAASNQESQSLKKALALNKAFIVRPPREAVQQADIIFLTTPFAANEAVLREVTQELEGKILVDCTNPVGQGLKHGLESRESGSEFIQRLVPKTKVLKAFTIYGFENFAYKAFPTQAKKPVMLFCGEDSEAKKILSGLIEDLGWEALDVGGLVQALHLEHMTLLWVRMVRMGGHAPNLLWSKF